MHAAIKKSLASLLVSLLLLFTLNISVYAAEPEVSSDAALLMEAKTGQVLFEKNGHEKLPPASTTKMITAILAIEKGRLSDIVPVSPHASQTEEAAMELKADEKLTLESLLYGALLWSSNDACVAIGEYIGGDEQKFVQMMNEKAKAIGAKDTNFCNTNGLPAKGHRSTAYDLALIARYAMQNQIFARMVGTRFKFVHGEKGQWPLDNTNRLLWSYAGANGVKTGTTEEAGLCLVSSATQNGRQLIGVVLHSDDRYSDSIRLLDYGFKNYRLEEVATRGKVYGSVPVVDGAFEKVAVTTKENLDASLPADNPDMVEKRVDLVTNLTAPFIKGKVVGEYSIYVKGQKVASTQLVTLSGMKEASMLQKIQRFLKKSF